MGDKINVLIEKPFINGEIDLDFDVAILYAPNGSGKSKVLRSINKIASSDSEEYLIQNIPPERGGSFEVTFGAADADRQSSSERKQLQLPSYRQRALSSIVTYAQIFTGSARVEPKQNEVKYFESKLEQVFPKYLFDIDIEKSTIAVWINSGAEEEIISTSDLSTSEADLVSVIIDSLVFASRKSTNKVLLIDEPSAYLNIDTVGRFARFVTQLSKEKKLKVIIGTNDHELVTAIDNYAGVDQLKVCLIGISSSGKLEQRSLVVGIYKSFFSGLAQQAKLANKKLLFVEGSDDEVILNKASRIPGGPPVISIEVGGTDSVPRALNDIEILARGALEPNLLAVGVRDLDNKQLGQIDSIEDDNNSRRSYVQELFLRCREIENIYLSDATLQYLGYQTFAEAELKIKELVNSEEGAIHEINELNEGNRRTFPMGKYVAKIHDRLSGKGDWKDIIARVIAKHWNDPNSDVREFLGEKLVQYLSSSSSK